MQGILSRYNHRSIEETLSSTFQNVLEFNDNLFHLCNYLGWNLVIPMVGILFLKYCISHYSMPNTVPDPIVTLKCIFIHKLFFFHGFKSSSDRPVRKAGRGPRGGRTRGRPTEGENPPPAVAPRQRAPARPRVPAEPPAQAPAEPSARPPARRRITRRERREEQERQEAERYAALQRERQETARVIS